MRISRFFSELSRRHVFRVAAAYAIVAWILIQVADITFPVFALPDWSLRLVVILALLGFPVAVILAWAYDMTSTGLERTSAQVGADDKPAEKGVAETGRSAAGVPAPHPLLVTADRDPRSIAVMPFVNLGGGSENEYFSDGITEDLIANLARAACFKVISRTSIMQYKGQDKSARQIGRELGVATLLEGSVRRADGQVRIVAQLIDARSDHHMWAETYDRKLEDIFEIQADVARRIADSLQAELSPREEEQLSLAPTRNPAAYDFYLRGRHEWNHRSSASLARSVAQLKRAVGADPSFALALAGLADSYLTLGIYGANAPHDVMPLAKTAAEKALAIDDEQAEALTALATVRSIYEWDWVGAESGYEQAISAGPNYSRAHHWLATNLLVPLGRFDEARASLERAQDLDPLAPTISVSFAVIDFFEGRFADATKTCRSILESSPDFWLTHFFNGWSLLEGGQAEEAIAAFESARDLSLSSVDALTGLACAQAVAGRTDEARQVLEQLLERAERSYVSPAGLARLHVILGEREAAISRLEEAVEVRAADLAWLAVHPTFQKLADDPRFEVIRQKVFGSST
jgi:serine/threonine-protein kinase